LTHFLSQPVDLSAGVTENDCLCDVQGVVEIAKSFELPLFTLDGDVELLNSFKSKFISLDQDLDGVVHELLGDFKGFWGHGSREEANLNAGWQEGEDVVDLILETSGEHFIGLIKNEDLDLVGTEDLAAQHVIDSAGGSDNDVNSGLQLGNVISDASSTNAGVAAGVKVVTEGDDDLRSLKLIFDLKKTFTFEEKKKSEEVHLLDLLSQLTGWGKDESLGLQKSKVELLEDTNGEGGGLSSSGLGLSDDIASLGEWKDSTLLNSGGLFETISVDSSQEVFLKAHTIEVINNFIPVGLEVINSQLRFYCARHLELTTDQFFR